MAAPLRLVSEMPDAAIAQRLQAIAPTVVLIGPLTVTVTIDPSRAQALISAALGGQALQTQVLTLAAPRLTIDVALGTTAAKGSVCLQLATPPAYSSVAADLTATDGPTTSPLRGDLASWVATNDPVVAEFDFQIAPDLSTHTTVRGFAGASADLAFMQGSTILACATTLQTWPQATFGRIEAGSIVIAAGATITLTIPTAEQQGMLMLQASFPNAPPADQIFSGAVAFWSLPGTV